MLTQHCVVRLAHDELVSKVSYLTNDATQHLPVLSTTTWEVDGTGPYLLSENGDRLAQVATADDVVYVLYQRTHRRAHEMLALSGWWLLHSAAATLDGERTLLVGSKGAGKSTLAAALLVDGQAVHGDEILFVRDGLSVSLPRPFHLKQGTLDLIPELGRHAAEMPSTSTGSGEVIRALDPTRLGYEWVIEPRPIDAVLLMNPRHGELPEIHRLATGDALPLVLGEMFRSDEPHRLLLQRATRLLGSTRVRALSVGEIRPTVALLRTGTG